MAACFAQPRLSMLPIRYAGQKLAAYFRAIGLGVGSAIFFR